MPSLVKKNNKKVWNNKKEIILENNVVFYCTLVTLHPYKASQINASINASKIMKTNSS